HRVEHVDATGSQEEVVERLRARVPARPGCVDRQRPFGRNDFPARGSPYAGRWNARGFGRSRFRRGLAAIFGCGSGPGSGDCGPGKKTWATGSPERRKSFPTFRKVFPFDSNSTLCQYLTKLVNYPELSMRLTTKGRFAVTAMIDLAMRQHQGPVTLAGISQRQ